MIDKDQPEKSKEEVLKPIDVELDQAKEESIGFPDRDFRKNLGCG